MLCAIHGCALDDVVNQNQRCTNLIGVVCNYMAKFESFFFLCSLWFDY